jgi:hypothetical protein
MIVMLFRPSPQIPERSVHAARMCYDASVFNVAMQREQIATGSVDLTWAFTQSLFMAINTILWSLSYPEIRNEHPIEEVRSHLKVALEGVALASERWPGVTSALHLYKHLVAACLKAYDTRESFVVHSPSNHPSPASAQDVTTPANVPSPSNSTTASFYSMQNVRTGPTISDNESYGSGSRGPSAEPPPQFPPAATSSVPMTTTHQAAFPPHTSQGPSPPSLQERIYNAEPYAPAPVGYSGVFDPATPFNSFPSVVPGLSGWDPNYTAASTTASHLACVDASVDPMFWLGSIGDQYSQYSNQPFPVTAWRGRTLSQQEQLELMDALADNIPDVSAQLMDETAIFYHS